METANVRSARNKTSLIVDHIIHSGTDLCCLTETWLKSSDTVSEAALAPEGYYYLGVPRPQDRIGGGTGLIVRASIKTNLLHSDEKSSFEYSEWLVAIDNLRVRLIIIYRPPYSEAHPVTTSTFFREFSDLLENCVLCPEKLILTGDFNIHVDDHT